MPIGADRRSTYRTAMGRWLARCDIRDEHGQPARLVPYQWRHTLGTALINKDVPQEVVRRILDHDSREMTANYAKSRVLHQVSEKPQVSRSWRSWNSLSDLRVATV